jgi:alpha-mannosidase
LHKAWELVCLNQFHDITPGSSVNQVYVESQQQYQHIREMAEEVWARSIAAVEGAMGLQNDEGSGSLLVINPTGFKRNDLAFWPGHLPPSTVLHHHGLPVMYQSYSEGTWIGLAQCPPYSINRLSFADEAEAVSSQTVATTGLTAAPGYLENDYIRVDINPDGDITRIFDKTASREVLPAGVVTNQFQAFEDRPLNWDAWDIDIFYDDHQWLCEPASSIEVVETGPLCAALRIKRRILHSDYVQTISLAFDNPRLDFDTHIDWREKHVLLKVAFPVMVLSPTATYEIQWGNVERPTHQNTSWDWARFETCAKNGLI